MIYLLDTNIVSHIIKGDVPRVRERLVEVPMHDVVISVITHAELQYGLAKRGHPPVLASKVREFLARVAVLPWTTEAALAYGELRAACEAGGITLAPMDLMIAAHAKSLLFSTDKGPEPAVLVTRDRAFARAAQHAGLQLEDWTV